MDWNKLYSVYNIFFYLYILYKIMATKNDKKETTTAKPSTNAEKKQRILKNQ